MEPGNVYVNTHGRPMYKIVLAVIKEEHKRWNQVVLLHVLSSGDVVGCSCSPIPYVRDHHDLVGKVSELPDFKVDWLSETETA